MDTIVFFTVLFSAFLHAIWNSMASKYKDKNVSIGAIVYGHVPLCIVAIIFLPAPSIESFPYIFLSAVIHQGYQNFLPKLFLLFEKNKIQLLELIIKISSKYVLKKL